MRLRHLAIACLPLLLLAAPVRAQTLGPDFVSDYSFLDLGGPAGIPSPLGGLTFKANDNDTLLIGGSANNTFGEIFEIPVTRDASGHIVAFAGAATYFATAPNIDGGLSYGPGGVLFFTTYSDNRMGQLLPGSTLPDKMIDLTPLGIDSSVGALAFVPAGFPGAGSLKICSFNANTWYEADLVPDGSGTYDLVNVVQTTTVTGGPEGMVYIDATNPAFTADSMLVAEWSANQVGAYEIDANGDPVLATRRDFMSSLSGAEGAVIDPVTGDFLFSTFGGGDRVIVVQGFTAPTVYCNGKLNSAGCTPTIEFVGSPTTTGPDDFVISSNQVTNNSFGIPMWSLTADNTPMWGGTLCVSGYSFLFPIQNSGGTVGPPALDCTGSFSYPITQGFLQANGLTAGTTVYVQILARDAGYTAPEAISLSDALSFTVQL